jgi:hypothetical protein
MTDLTVCPTCRMTHGQSDDFRSLICADAFHREEPGRLWDAQRQETVLIPARLCRCVPCCCGPDVGHNSTAWKAYEAAQRALDVA